MSDISFVPRYSLTPATFVIAPSSRIVLSKKIGYMYSDIIQTLN